MIEKDLHRKIVLRQDVVIQERKQPAIDGLRDIGQLVLLKTESDIVTITPLMRKILEVARTPHTPDELIQWVAKISECSYESVYPSVSSFLKRMGMLGVLVYEEIKQSQSAEILEKLDKDKSFAGYALLARISKNHRAILYKCSFRADDLSFYTLKVLLKRNPSDSALRKFFKESEMLWLLPNHRNIRNCLYASVHKGIPYLLFEYIDGVPMSKKIDTATLDLKKSIASQLMKAIDHLHHHHILHGDIHTSNFLIDDENRLHLIDLGMAYFEHEAEVHHGGIPRYMPPERMSDHSFHFSKKRGDYCSEVFQIGVCLYFLFSGNFPFGGLLLKDLASAIKYDTPPPLVKTPLGEIIPQDISSVIFKSLEKNPIDRYSSVASMRDAWLLTMHDEELILN